MNISFFEKETKYQTQLQKLNSFFKVEIQTFSTFEKVFRTRATIDLNYSRDMQIIVKELENQLQKVYNEELKNGIKGICQDWKNMAENRKKIANEYLHIAQNDIKKFIDTYKVDYIPFLKNYLKKKVVIFSLDGHLAFFMIYKWQL
jgi:hypothetical protein